MTWNDLINGLWAGEKVAITVADGNSWFSDGSVSSLDELQWNLQRQIPGAVMHRAPMEALVAHFPAPSKRSRVGKAKKVFASSLDDRRSAFLYSRRANMNGMPG